MIPVSQSPIASSYNVPNNLRIREREFLFNSIPYFKEITPKQIYSPNFYNFPKLLVLFSILWNNQFLGFKTTSMETQILHLELQFSAKGNRVIETFRA